MSKPANNHQVQHYLIGLKMKAEAVRRRDYSVAGALQQD